MDAAGGYIVTNNHVVERADEITITFSDGRSLPAVLVGTDPQVDLAVLKVAPEELTEISFADSAALRVGDFVVAIGNPFGLSQTVTSGIVSALGRSGLGIEGYEDFIQTDANLYHCAGSQPFAGRSFFQTFLQRTRQSTLPQNPKRWLRRGRGCGGR